MTDVAAPRKRRRWLGVLIALVVLAALAVAAWFVGDRIARDYAVDLIHDQLVVAFPSSDPQVTVAPGSVLAMAIAGSLDAVSVDMGTTEFGDISGSLKFDATGVPIDSTKPIENLDITFDIAEADVQRIITDLDGLENAELSLADNEVALASSFEVFGASIPLGISFAPSVADSAIVLTPATVSVNGAVLNLTDLASGPFGSVVTGIVKPQTVCVAQYLPAVLTLTDATVTGDRLRLGISGDGIALERSDFTALGTC